MDIIEDTGISTQKGQVDIKAVILRHIRKISDLTCQELTPRYWDKKPVKIGGGVVMAEIYHPDLREAYINAVDFLLDVILPYTCDEKGNPFDKVLKKLKEEEDTEFERLNGTQDDWIRIKLRLRRRLFGEIMIFINRFNFFEEEVYIE